MSAGAVGHSVTTDDRDLAARVHELGRAERVAIDAGDWEALDSILDGQRALWQELVSIAGDDGDSEGSREALQALQALYQVRRRNHSLIERSLAELRRCLAVAHAQTSAVSTYRENSRQAV